MQPAPPVRVRKGLSRVKLATILGVIAIAIVVSLALFVVPLSSRTFSGMVSTVPEFTGPCAPFNGCSYYGTGQQDLPNGVLITMNWQSTDGRSVNISASSSEQPVANVCNQNGTSGTCTFMGVGGTYTISVWEIGWGPVSVTYSGSYAAPYY